MVGCADRRVVADFFSVAVANIRGGGEYGKKWHEAALGVNRAVSFDDFAYAAKYLHQKRVTVPSMTACYGISNGGLLVGANVNRHPDLWKVALPDVGVFDLTRFHKFVSDQIIVVYIQVFCLAE